jgi:hypothetical protein
MEPETIDDTLSLRNWAAFYSILIDEACLRVICRQARALVGVSKSLSDWHNSSYGQILKIIDSATLTKLHQVWVEYAKFRDFTQSQLASLRNSFLREFRDIYEKKFQDQISLGAVRSAGAPYMTSPKTVMDVFEQFWRTGVISGLAELTSAANYLNPLFLYSSVGGDHCAIHYGSDPISGFHCGSAFVDILPSLLSSSTKFAEIANIPDSVTRMAKTAILEFTSWCVSFQSTVSRGIHTPGLLSVSHVCVDALEFCHTLQALETGDSKTTIYQSSVPPWRHVNRHVQPDFEYRGSRWFAERSDQCASPSQTISTCGFVHRKPCTSK